MLVTKKKSLTALPWPATRGNETDEERKARKLRAAEAKRRNDAINRELEAERQRIHKQRAGKILLLGQAESGKSTVLKNFQLHLAPKAFELEAEIWRPVIHLNLVRSVNFIVNLAMSRGQLPRQENPKVPRGPRKLSTSMTPELRKLTVRLAPLRQVEEHLIQILSGQEATNDSGVALVQPYNPTKAPDITLSNGTQWRKAMTVHRKHSIDSMSSTASRESTEIIQCRRMLTALSSDIEALWANRSVQEMLKTADIALHEQPGFFLDQVKRVTGENFRPRPDDVLKARVNTLGPEEHTIVAESGSEKEKHYTIYDVGGSRSQRIDIIIFLAPMSGFNQVLAEDTNVNRLTDSLRLWQSICSNRILAGVEFVLFLNKLDILESKLKSGIQFADFVTSYGNKPNETEPVSKYLLDVFIRIHKQYSPKRRKLHSYLTCAVDTKATSDIITKIQDVILMKILARVNLV
ncbi:Guanine nucleotide-binding protein alpha-4 subunit [Psilocybe cubensis]|uniref:Guanine nucleotide-binding protein alpha-4 subunit n=1 Tax=Psilocybe cubensis TaxID=181762 RepID=A0ACB8GRL7_PSICU|nr:Guanine nucleotide-binding protein alpha-4 subunit [Psilocybe cubensis]KAH9477866.1 Guanine nucleotide-binding protein alpha-4 subunit [Psilocybe cubensis]